MFRTESKEIEIRRLIQIDELFLLHVVTLCFIKVYELRINLFITFISE